jgi:hypothetical protein
MQAHFERKDQKIAQFEQDALRYLTSTPPPPPTAAASGPFYGNNAFSVYNEQVAPSPYFPPTWVDSVLTRAAPPSMMYPTAATAAPSSRWSDYLNPQSGLGLESRIPALSSLMQQQQQQQGDQMRMLEHHQQWLQALSNRVDHKVAAGPSQSSYPYMSAGARSGAGPLDAVTLASALAGSSRRPISMPTAAPSNTLPSSISSAASALQQPPALAQPAYKQYSGRENRAPSAVARPLSPTKATSSGSGDPQDIVIRVRLEK